MHKASCTNAASIRLVDMHLECIFPSLSSHTAAQGKGLGSTYATRAPFHVEGGKETTSKVVKFQLHCNPLAR